MAHTSTCAQNYKFTGYERDSETGLDYAVNRYYNSRIGRFMSADPSGLASASPNNPQSLHRYAYVLNNPLIGIDPFGLECAFMSADGSSVEEVDPTDENDHSSGTDSASCAGNGGYYFDSNNEVNYDNYAQDGGNWGRFDIDAESNWVGLTDDNGNSTGQFNCQGSACGVNSFLSFAGAEGFFPTGIDKYNQMEKGKINLRDMKAFCSMHVTFDPSTGQASGHLDVVNPEPTPSLPIPGGDIFSLAGHLLYDAAPDYIYRKTGTYLFAPAGRNACQ